MSRFLSIHPLAQMLFYIVSLGIVLTVCDPVFSAVSLLFGITFYFELRGRDAFKTVGFISVLIVMVSAFNMLFAHYGETVLFKIRDTEFTLQALFYGFNQGMVLSSVMVWFSAFSRTVDSDKIIYVFRYTPKTALMFSMILGFIPRFTKKLSDIRTAQLALRGRKDNMTFKDKFTQSLDNLSALVTYSLESSIITSNSMKAREYNPKAIAPSRFKIKSIDIIIITLVIICASVISVMKIKDEILFVFEPVIFYQNYNISAYVLFAVMESLPFFIETGENIKWKILS